MKINPILRLKSYLENSCTPTWSSHGIRQIFKDLNGTMIEKQQIVFPLIDEAFSSNTSIINEYQLNFIKDIMIHSGIAVSRIRFKREDLKWLFERFKNKPTQQRAFMLYIL